MYYFKSIYIVYALKCHPSDELCMPNVLNVQRQTDSVFIRLLAALALVRQVVVLQLLQIRNADGAGLVFAGLLGLMLLGLMLWLWQWLLCFLLQRNGFGLQARKNVGNVGGAAHVGAFGHRDWIRRGRGRTHVARRGQIRAVGGRLRGVVSRPERRARIRVGITHAGGNRWWRWALVRNVGRRLAGRG